MPSTGITISAMGSDLPAGIKVKTLCERVAMDVPAASHSVTPKLPAGAVVLVAEMRLKSAISAATATKVGLGRLTATAAPSKYALSSGLAAENVAPRIQNQWGSPLAAEEELAVFACDNAGAASGTIGGAGQFALVRISYIVPEAILTNL